jgi:hypothetical protein
MKKKAREMRNSLLIVVLGILLGLTIGPCSALLRVRQTVPVGGAKVEVDKDDFDFGELDAAKEGSHEFKFSNRGTAPLKLTRGASTCKCTVGEIPDGTIAPGQSTTVRITWKSKHVAGPFKQSVTIHTNDPIRPEVILTINGQFTEPLHIDPDELNFGQIVGNEPVTQEARILCNLPDHPLKVSSFEFTDHDLAPYFQVETRPMETVQSKPGHRAAEGVFVRVTVKPGLPPGRFQQRILLRTNLSTVPEVDLPLFGSIGKDVAVVGPGWDDDLGVLNIGPIKTGEAVQRQLLLIARGSDAKDIRYNVVHVKPDFLRAKLGETKVSEGGKLSRTGLTIEIPEQHEAKSYMGDDRGKPGEIDIDTTSSEIHQVRVRVRFAVEDGKQG